MTGHLPLPVRVLLQCTRHLHGLRRWAWILGLLYGALPVRVGVLEEDHVPVLFAGRAALLHDVPQRGRSLEEPQLRLEVLLAVFLGLAGPEHVARVEEHLGRQGIDTVLRLACSVVGLPKRRNRSYSVMESGACWSPTVARLRGPAPPNRPRRPASATSAMITVPIRWNLQLKRWASMSSAISGSPTRFISVIPYLLRLTVTAL
jgi:hypothetical protein